MCYFIHELLMFFQYHQMNYSMSSEDKMKWWFIDPNIPHQTFQVNDPMLVFSTGFVSLSSLLLFY